MLNSDPPQQLGSTVAETRVRRVTATERDDRSLVLEQPTPVSRSRPISRDRLDGVAQFGEALG